MLPPDAVPPSYDGRGLANVLASATAPFGGMPGALPLLAPDVLPREFLEGVERVVLVVVDGLGWDQMRAHVEAEPDLGLATMVQHGHAAPITSVSPSTTAAALATLSTGVAPLAHGILGYRMFMPSLGVTVNSIQMRPVTGGRHLHELGVDPALLLPPPTVFERLAEAGVPARVLTRKAFTDSPLTRLVYRGTTPEGFVGLGDAFALARKRLADARGGKLFLRVYWDHVDDAAHAYGPEAPEHAAEVAQLGFALERELLARVRDPGALLLVTADHGHVHVGVENTVPLNEHPGLLQELAMPPTGEGRFAFLHVRDGRREAARRYAETHLADHCVVADMEKLVASGLFGPPEHAHPEACARLGDLALLAKGTKRFVYDLTTSRGPPTLVGHHGGLMAGEMRVPLLAMRLG